MPPDNVPPLWQILLASAVGSAVVTLLGTMLVEYLRHNRAKVQHFQQLILDRKIHECEKVLRLTNRLVADIAPIANGFRAFQPAEEGDWKDYRARMVQNFAELELSFEENAIVLGKTIMEVWHRYSGEAAYFARTAQFGRPSAADMDELIRFCRDFPSDLCEAIETSIKEPSIELLGTSKRLEIRNKAGEAIEARVKAVNDVKGKKPGP